MLTFNSNQYVDVQSLVVAGLISKDDVKKTFDGIPSDRKVMVVSDEAYDVFSKYADFENAEVQPWVISEQNQGLSGDFAAGTRAIAVPYIRKAFKTN